MQAVRMRIDTRVALWALVGSAAACSHGRLEARQIGPSLGLSSRFVSVMRRQNRGSVNMFLNQIRNTSEPLFACYIGGEPGREPQNSIDQQTVNLQGEEEDPNNDLGISSYFMTDGKQTIMFDTLTSLTLASACLDMVQRSGQSENIGAVQQVVLSHKHQDHIARLSAPELNQAQVIAQDNTKKALARGQGRVPDQTYTNSAQLALGRRGVSLLHFVGHTNDGTGACVGDLCLMGDECEDNIPFIAEPERIESQIQNLGSTIEAVQGRGVDKVCPAHGNGNTIAQGCFSLALCQSNKQYLQLMASNLEETCAQSLPQLAPQIGRRAEDITKAYAAVHQTNCDSLEKVRGSGRQQGGLRNRRQRNKGQ